MPLLLLRLLLLRLLLLRLLPLLLRLLMLRLLLLLPPQRRRSPACRPRWPPAHRRA
jgi:hypothetical protein